MSRSHAAIPCGCAEPPDSLFADHRPHERDRLLHPLCSERAMECTALLKYTPKEKYKLAAAGRRRGRRFTVAAAYKKCRHKCGCSVSRHKRFEQTARLTHERDETLHMHCKSLGLDCAQLFEKENKAGECRHSCGSCTSPAGTVHLLMRKHEKDDSLHPQCRASGGDCVALLSIKARSTSLRVSTPAPVPLAEGGAAAVPNDEPAVLSSVDVAVCSHTCGCVLPAGEDISNMEQHERSAVWHPDCAEKAQDVCGEAGTEGSGSCAGTCAAV